MDDKPGIKTSEFWLNLAAIVVAAFISSGLLPEGHVALKVAVMVSTVLGALGYTVARSMVKANRHKADATKEVAKHDRKHRKAEGSSDTAA